MRLIEDYVDNCGGGSESLGNNYFLVVTPDYDAPDPRELNDNLAKMLAFHGRYVLGDKNLPLDSDDYTGWEDVLKNGIEEAFGGVIALPLYLYDHSGLTMSTKPFACGWDSGQVGWIFVTKEDALYEAPEGVGIYDWARGMMIGEVKEYDEYLRGEVYEVLIIKRTVCKECNGTDDEIVQSLTGVYPSGLEYAKQELKELEGI